MAVTYESLITPMTRAQIVAIALDVLKAAGLTVTAWGPTDEPRAIVEYEAAILEGLSEDVVAIGRMALLDLAEGDALTLHARDTYGIERKPAVQARGAVKLTDSAGSPQTFSAGDLIVVSRANPDLYFTNVGSVSVPASSDVTFTIGAEQTGARYNIDALDLALATPVPGLTLTAAPDTSWITQSGADEESDASLRLRCQTKRAASNVTGPYDSYISWALSASSEVNRVFVQEDPLAVAGSPSVTVIIATAAGAPTTAALNAVTASVESKRPLGVLVAVSGAITSSVTLRGTIRCKAAHRATAEAKVNDLLTRWFSGNAIKVGDEEVPGLAIGAGIWVSQLYEIIHSATGVVNVDLRKSDGTPMVPGVDDILLSGNAVATLGSLALLTWVNV